MLRLNEAPFDKTDAELLANAGSCLDCVKRTGYNRLLFEEIQEDSCTDGECYRSKIDRHVALELAAKPDLIQISTSWGSKAADGAIARSAYVEIVKRPRGRKKADDPAWQRCEHAKSAIVTEGVGRGFARLVCAEPSCEIHHLSKRSLDDDTRKRCESLRSEAKRRKQELADRSKLLDSILAKVAAPLLRDNLEVIALAFLDKLGHESRVRLAKRWNLEVASGSHSGNYLAAMMPQIQGKNESELSRILVEMALLDLATNVFYAEGAAKLEEILKVQATQ